MNSNERLAMIVGVGIVLVVVIMCVGMVGLAWHGKTAPNEFSNIILTGLGALGGALALKPHTPTVDAPEAGTVNVNTGERK